MNVQFKAPNPWLTLASVATEPKEMMEWIKQETSTFRANCKSFQTNSSLESADFITRALLIANKIKEMEQFTIVQMLSQHIEAA